jgi:hypothetical protein
VIEVANMIQRERIQKYASNWLKEVRVPHEVRTTPRPLVRPVDASGTSRGT